VTVAGASEIDLRGFEGERLAITSSGAVDIEGHSSRYGVLDLTMSGAGQADLRDVVVTDANVALTGAADVTLRMAGGRLAGRIAGAGKVAYYGTVSEQSIATSGIGTVERVD
jgi:hypothetical protein